MLKFMRWILGLIAVVITLTAIALNPQTTQLNWNPAAPALDLPVYVIILTTFIFGYLIGTLYLWLTQLPGRLEAAKTRKQQEKTIKKLEAELETHNNWPPVKEDE